MRIIPILLCACALLLPACVASSPEKPQGPALSSEQTAEQTPAAPDTIEIPIGSPMASVLKALGPADATDLADGGREIWRYTRKRAEYAYTSKNSGVDTLVIGKYIADPQTESPGQTLLLTIVFDAAKKLADFNFALMAY